MHYYFHQGTTGSPKGATLCHHSILNNAFFVGEILNYEEVRHLVSYARDLVVKKCGKLAWIKLQQPNE